MQGLAVTSWPGLVLGQVGTVRAPVCLLLPRAASLCFGFALLWIRSALDLLLVPAQAGESQ